MIVPGDGKKRPPGGVLGIDPDFDGVTVEVDVRLLEAERLPRRHAQLQRHQVAPDYGLRSRMLYLQPGVHLEEVEVAVLVDELDRAGVDVAAGSGHLDGGGAHGVQDLGAQIEGAGASSMSFW